MTFIVSQLCRVFCTRLTSMVCSSANITVVTVDPDASKGRFNWGRWHKSRYWCLWVYLRILLSHTWMIILRLSRFCCLSIRLKSRGSMCIYIVMLHKTDYSTFVGTIAELSLNNSCVRTRASSNTDAFNGRLKLNEEPWTKISRQCILWEPQRVKINSAIGRNWQTYLEFYARHLFYLTTYLCSYTIFITYNNKNCEYWKNFKFLSQ